MKRIKILAILVGLAAITIFSSDAFTRGRMYNPQLGRFMQRDPIGYIDGMSLYQYTQSNPIIRTDPTGGCSASEREKALKCKCFCVESVKIKGKAINIVDGFVGAQFTVTINGKWKKAPEGNGGMPILEWWEYYEKKPGFYPNKLKKRKWWDMHKEMPDHSTFDPVNLEKMGGFKNQFTLTDKPGCSFSAAPFDQTAYWAIRVKSTPGCNCKIKEKTVYAEQRYSYGHGKGTDVTWKELKGLPDSDPTK